MDNQKRWCFISEGPEQAGSFVSFSEEPNSPLRSQLENLGFRPVDADDPKLRSLMWEHIDDYFPEAREKEGSSKGTKKKAAIVETPPA